MRETILSGRTPSLVTLQYDLAAWNVVNLSVVPSFAFTLSCLQERPPLSPAAKRGPRWIGCNILLRNIPPDARIPMVRNGVVEEPSRVRKQFARLKPISAMAPEQRGWTLDVLNVVRRLNRETFTLLKVLESAAELARLHPENKHVPDKVRQQLQKLRDLGFLEFVDNKGTYRLKSAQ
jgi:type II restriction enzyme